MSDQALESKETRVIPRGTIMIWAGNFLLCGAVITLMGIGSGRISPGMDVELVVALNLFLGIPFFAMGCIAYAKN